jgi:hypothetical protein
MHTKEKKIKKIEEENRLDPPVLTWLCVSQDEVLVVE